MPNPVLQSLSDQVTQTTTVEQSAVVLINGIAQQISDAIAKAIGNGATEAELAPVQEKVDALKQSATDLSNAIAANTPAAAMSKKKP